MVMLFGLGSFLLTTFSYLLGTFKIFTNLPAVINVLSGLF